MKASDLSSKPVVSLNNGTKVGEIAGLTLDSTNTQIGSIHLVGTAGRFSIPFSAIRSVGADAVTINDSQLLRPHVNDGDERLMSSLMGLQVVNQMGSIIGSVEDIDIDEATGMVSSLLIHHGGILGIGTSHVTVPAAAIRGIGAKLITVDTASNPANANPAT